MTDKAITDRSYSVVLKTAIKQIYEVKYSQKVCLMLV